MLVARTTPKLHGGPNEPRALDPSRKIYGATQNGLGDVRKMIFCLELDSVDSFRGVFSSRCGYCQPKLEIYIYIYVYVYIYICLYVFIYIYICIHTCIFYIYIYICVCTYICVWERPGLWPAIANHADIKEATWDAPLGRSYHRARTGPHRVGGSSQ